MNSEASIKDIIKFIWNNLIIIVAFMIIGGIAVGGFAKHKQSTSYQSTRNIMLYHTSNNNTDGKESQFSEDANMIETYAFLAKDRTVISDARKTLNNSLKKKYSTSDITNMVSTGTKPNVLVFSIKITTMNPKDSVAITNAVSQSFSRHIKDYIDSTTNVKLLSSATMSEVQSSTKPSVKKYALLGLVIGALVGMIISFVKISWRYLS